LSNRADLSDDDAVNVRKLLELRRELDSFLYFSATTAEFFSKFKTQKDWSEAIDQGLVEKLGRARQAFELNVGVVEIRLDELRQSCSMPEAERWASKRVSADKKSHVARRRKKVSES
jgi:type I site-specific restriction endonuclease